MATAPFYVDGDWTLAAPAGQVRFEQPFAGDKGEYVLVQDWMQLITSFAPLALNTPHPSFLTYLLVSEGPLADQGGGIARWTRKYAQTPATRNDYTSIAYSFIGFYGKTANIVLAGSFPVLGRNRLNLTVPCRVQNDYFFVDGTIIPTPGSIPVILGQRYYVPLGTITGGSFVPAYAAGSANDINYGTATDFIWDPAAFGGLIPTEPSRTAYQALVNSGSEIVVEDSQISRWLGNIYQRVTKYIVAR